MATGYLLLAIGTGGLAVIEFVEQTIRLINILS